MRFLVALFFLTLFCTTELYSQVVQWGNGFPGTSIDAYSYTTSVDVDQMGNSYITGSFNDVIDFDPSGTINTLTSVNFGDLFVAKYSYLGSLLWKFHLFETNGNYSSGVDLQYDNVGGIVLLSDFVGEVDMDHSSNDTIITSLTAHSLNLSRYDTTGSLEWAFNIPGAVTGWSEHNTLACDQFGNIYITGYFLDSIDLDPSSNTQFIYSEGGRDIFVAKYDNQGNLVFANSIRGIAGDQGLNIAVDLNQYIYLTGWFNGTVDFDIGPGSNIETSPGMDYSEFIACYDNSGNYEWVHAYGGFLKTSTHSISCSPDNSSLFFSGYVHTNDLVDIDPGLDTNSISKIGERDFFIVKYDVFGNYQWKNQISCLSQSSFLIPGKIAIDNDGSAYLTGGAIDSVDFDPYGSGMIKIPSEDYSSDAILAKYDELGNIVWGHFMGSSLGQDVLKDIAVHNQSILVIGETLHSNDFDPSSSNFEIPTTFDGSTNGLLIRYDNIYAGFKEKETDFDELIIYPNPTSNNVFIKVSSEYIGVDLFLYDMFGKLIKSQKITSNTERLDLNNLEKGTYFIQINSGIRALSKKVIKL